MNKNLFSNCFIKEEKFKPIALGGNDEIIIRQLTISESQEFREILQDDTKTQNDAMFYAVKCSMVKPEFFTDEEIKKLNIIGFNLIKEIYSELPLIGKTKKEREEYTKNIEKLIKQSQENQEKVFEDIEEKK